MSPGAADSGGEAARLDELAKVTKQYSRYMTTAFGLAHTALGAWLAGALLVGVRWPAAGVNLGVVAPLVWLGALACVRRRYQRYGVVVQAGSPQDPALRGVTLGFTYLFCVLGVLVASRFGTVTLLLASGTFVAAPALAARWTRGTGDAAMTSTAVAAALLTFDAVSRPLSRTVALVAVLVVLALLGIVFHVRFVRLERRLAGLKGGVA